MGKLRYILIFGVLGFGLAFGLGITAAGLLDHPSHGLVFNISKLVLSSVLFGWFQGARTWSEAFAIQFRSRTIARHRSESALLLINQLHSRPPAVAFNPSR